jgi:RNA polymerase sigma factor (sigma-70 family)
MEASALRYSGGIGLQGRSPLLRLQSDERLISMVRRGSPGAFEVLVSRYQARLLAFCRHLLGSREDAEDVLQEVLAAAFNAILADERAINVRPWLYRIARNRCLNHLRRIQAVGVDSMDIHLSDHGATTADKVHGREEFRTLVDDIRRLAETQRTALVLREMDALSYEQIAEAMETTVPSVKSLLVRARVSLAEAAEARQLSCEDVRVELAEIAEGLHKKSGPLVRRHLRTCKRCSVFSTQLRRTNKALTALLPIGPLALLRKVLITHIGHSAGAGSSAAGSGAAGQAAAIGSGQAAALGSSAAAGSTAMIGSGAGGLVSVSIGTIATKAAASLAAAALVTAGAVEVSHGVPSHHRPAPVAQASIVATGGAAIVGTGALAAPAAVDTARTSAVGASKRTRKHRLHQTKASGAVKPAVTPASKTTQVASAQSPATAPGRTQTQTVGTVLPSTTTTPGGTQPGTSNTPPPTGTDTTPTTTPPGTTTPTSTTPPPTTGPVTTPTTPTTTSPSTTGTVAPGASTLSGSSVRSAPRPARHGREPHRRHRAHRPARDR